MAKENAKFSKDATECGVKATFAMAKFAAYRGGKGSSKDCIEAMMVCTKAGHSYMKTFEKSKVFGK